MQITEAYFGSCQISMMELLGKKFNVNYPVSIYLFKVDNRNTRTRFEICSKLIRSYVNDVVLVSLLLTLNIFDILFWCFYC